VICAIHKDERYLIGQLKGIMESFLKIYFDFDFPVEVSVGKNYKDMEVLND
jgi:hypothetical protein